MELLLTRGSYLLHFPETTGMGWLLSAVTDVGDRVCELRDIARYDLSLVHDADSSCYLSAQCHRHWLPIYKLRCEYQWALLSRGGFIRRSVMSRWKQGLRIVCPAVSESDLFPETICRLWCVLHSVAVTYDTG